MTLLIALIGLLPACPAKNVLLRRLGWSVGSRVSIGPSLFLRVEDVELREEASIGSFNVFRDLYRLELGAGASVAQWNWASAARLALVGRWKNEGSLILGDHSAITSRHYLDGTGGVFVGPFATVAGVRSTFITHGIDPAAGRQSTRPIEIGAYSLVSSNTKVVPGAAVPARSLVAMGAVVTRGLTEECTLYAGTPARPVKRLRPDSKYFTRTRGPVELPVIEDHA